MPNDLRNLGVVIDVGQNPLADHGVLFHLTAFVKSESTRLLKKSWRKPNLPNVVNKSAQVGKLNLGL